MAGEVRQRKKILVLPSWYPSKLDKFAGDFIQRHVHAISGVSDQYVIYVVKDERATVTDDMLIDINETEYYTEKIIYYHTRKTGIKALDKLASQLKYNRLYKQAVLEYMQHESRPQLIHLHVSLKAGLVALWAKDKWKLPFVISEHWSVFLPEANYKLSDLPFFDRWAVRKLLKNAAGLSVVSARLGRAISDQFSSPSFTVIPNVVDHALFFPVERRQNQHTHFIHASSMLYEKNVESILHAFQLLKEKKIDCGLDVYGPAPQELQQLSAQLGLRSTVFFYGEVPQNILATKMQESDALILYSRFETFGCVLIEANAVGIPVIVSDIPVFHETVTENVNGFFVDGERADLLAEKIQTLIEKKNLAAKNSIVTTTRKYAYETVAAQFLELYDKALEHH